ncbi:dihydrofolate reductase family protein [Spirosoma migulaei]
MHLSLDNYVNMERGGKNFKWDHEVIKFCVANLDNVDTILLGRKTAQDLIPFWDNVATDSSHPDFALGQRISELPKVVFSNTLTELPWKNTTLIRGDMPTELSKLKKSAGNAILVYGGASFAASLIQAGLVDEFYFLLNPFRLGKGVTLFQANDDVQVFTLIKSMPFPCGTVLLQYNPNQL